MAINNTFDRESISRQLGEAREQALSIQETLENQEQNNNSQTDTGNSESVVMKELRQRLLSSDGIVSSSNTGLEDSLERIQQSGQDRAQAISSRFNNSIRDAQGAGSRNATNVRESTGGFATNLAALREVTRMTDERIGSLEQQRENALLNDRSDIADQINNMILQERQMEQRARESAVSNLSNFARMEQSQNQFEMSKNQQQSQFDTREDRLQDAQDTQDAQNKIQFLKDNNLLSNASEAELGDIERQYGIPEGSLSKIQNIPELNLRTISGVGLVNVTQDENGNPVTQVIAAERKETEEEEEPVFSFSKSSIGTLVKADIVPSDIPLIQKAINTYGLNFVINNYDINEAQKEAIANAVKEEEGLSTSYNNSLPGNQGNPGVSED